MVKRCFFKFFVNENFEDEFLNSLGISFHSLAPGYQTGPKPHRNVLLCFHEIPSSVYQLFLLQFLTP